jgi:predicted transcriptional regulator of viral defense system
MSIERKVITTEEAAALLNRKPQTLRVWASRENGPIRPIRINGRLAWKLNEIELLIAGGA